MEPLAIVNGIYSRKADQILAALKALQSSGEKFVGQVVHAGVMSGEMKVGTDVIWKTPDNSVCGTPDGNLAMLAWMIRNRSRTSVGIALSATISMEDQRLERLALLLCKEDSELKQEVFPSTN